MSTDLDALRSTVQRNCDVCDARHAGDLTMCTYLLRMREYFRWERGYPYGAPLHNDEVGEWVRERERRWESLREAEYEPIPVNGGRVDPFETARINEALVPEGLVYGGGLGAGLRPHFFLARLVRREEHDGCTVLVSDEEYARGLSAPPALSLGGLVFLRRAALRQLLWEKVEEWRWSRRPDNPMGRAIACHPFGRDPAAALEAMTEEQLETVRLHELGEIHAGRLLGPGWERMLAALPRSRVELAARAVRDHLADCLSTLPALADDPRPGRIHFLLAMLSGMRRELFPALREAYEAWRAHDDTGPLREVAARGAEHWARVARELLALHEDGGTAAVPAMEALIGRATL